MKKTKTFLAIGLSVSLAVWTVMFGFQAQKAEGATLKTISDTLSDSDLGVGANHTVRLTTPTGIAAGLTITYNLPSVTTTTGFASSSVIALGLLDFDFMIGTTEQTVTTPGGCSGATTVGIATNHSRNFNNYGNNLHIKFRFSGRFHNSSDRNKRRNRRNGNPSNYESLNGRVI